MADEMKKTDQSEILDARDYAELDFALESIRENIYKNYYSELDTYSIMNPTESLERNDVVKNSRIFKIKQIEVEKEADINDRMSTVFSTATSLGNSLAVIVESRATGIINFYMGIVNAPDRDLELCGRLLLNTFTAYFPGSKLEEVDGEQFQAIIDNTFFKNRKRTISTVSGLSVTRNDKDEVKGHAMDRFLSTMRKKVYTAVFIIDPVSRADSDALLEGYQNIFSTLSPFARSVWSYNESSGNSVLSSVTKGISASVTESLGKTKGYALTHTDNTFESVAAGINVQLGKQSGTSHQESHADGGSESTSTSIPIPMGAIIKLVINAACVGSIIFTEGASIPLATAIMSGVNGVPLKSRTEGQSSSWQDSVIDGISKSVSGSVGGNLSRARGSGYADTYSENYGLNEIVGQSKGESEQKSQGTQKTENAGKNLQIEYTNREIVDLLSMLEKQISRINECRDYGLFNVGAYFISPLEENSILAANVYKSVKQGKDSSNENIAVNTWSERNAPHHVSMMKKYLSNMVQPVFFKQFRMETDKTNEIHVQLLPVSAGTVMSGKEVSLFVDAPRNSVNGLVVNEHVEFGHNISVGKEGVGIGKIIEYGTPAQKLFLDMDKLTMHTFVSGSTGSGKSNTIYKLLTELGAEREEFHFLVIEPAKGEYKEILGQREDVVTYGTNPNIKDSLMLSINPFHFPAETIHVLEHMDRLVEIFNVCWPMYAAMPAILKEAIERAYIYAGWDLENSVNKYDSELFPTFEDVLREIKNVIHASAYSDDNKGDYTGALVTRLKSLTNGINGQIFKANAIPDTQLFDENVIIDLSRIGSGETKAFIMGLITLKLQEYRMDAGERNSRLKHITVLEEAHHLLRRTSVEQTSEGSNLRGKSVEMIANAIAEMRTYGEGFIIVDQAPGLLDMSVIRNTGTKIILRLPDYSDRELAGKSAGLSENQIAELAQLEKGVAAISQSDWLEPVLCRIDEYKIQGETVHGQKRDNKKHKGTDIDEISDSLLNCIMTKEIYRKGDRVDARKLKDTILKSKLNTAVKCDFVNYINAEKESAVKSLRTLIYDFLNADKAVDESRGCSDLSMWVHSVADKLSPDITGYSRRQIDLVMALLVYELTLRNPEYNDLFCRFAEIYKKEGGVF